jgi:tetratricopeptide (TPR) repeat protein
VHKNIFWIVLLLLVCLAPGCSATKKKGNEADVHYFLGLSYLREQNPTRALKEFLLAQEFDSRNSDIQDALGQSYHLKKAYSEAEKHYLKALELSRDDPRFQNNLAALYLDMQRWDDAISCFQKASSNLLFITPEVALSGMGYAYFQKGEYPDAVTAYKEALAHNHRYPLAHLRLGEVHFAQEKTDLAIEEFCQALSLSPNYILAHYKLALSYMKLQKAEEAVSSFQAVIRLAPDSELAQLARDHLKNLQGGHESF